LFFWLCLFVSFFSSFFFFDYRQALLCLLYTIHVLHTTTLLPPMYLSNYYVLLELLHSTRL
jgi:hypothetical protein